MNGLAGRLSQKIHPLPASTLGKVNTIVGPGVAETIVAEMALRGVQPFWAVKRVLSGANDGLAIVDDNAAS